MPMEKEAVEKSKPIISASMVNMADKPMIWGMLMSLGTVVKLAQKAGHHGVEYFPWRLADLQVRSGLVSDKTLEGITSAHQSFRSEKSWREIKAHPNPKLALQAYMTTAERIDSLKSLQKLQHKDCSLPLVIYPYHEWLGEQQYPLFASLYNKLVQAAPELLDRWHVKAENLGSEAQNRDYSGLVIDLFHLRRLPIQGFTTQFERWQEALPKLLPFTKEIHLGVDRDDMVGSIDSMAELKDLYHGDRNTEIVNMLEMIKREGKANYIVTEIPAQGIARLSGNTILTPTDWVKAHHKIVQNLQEILK